MYTASALASGGKLFQTVFGLDYHYALLIGAAVILAYTFMGGFLAVCTTDFVQGTMMLIALLTVPIIAYAAISGDFTGALTAHGVAENSDFLSLFYMDGKPYPLISIVSDLAWGLGYCGMPHILVRFMAVKSEKELKKSSVIGILAAIMSTADSQLLVCASSASKDIFKNILKPEAEDKKVLNVSRITVLVIAVVACIIAWNPDSSIMGLVSDAWAGLGSAFGPLVVCSLFWKRTNLPGAVAGIVSGGLFVIIWDYLPILGGQTPYAVTGIYSLLLGFFVSLLCIVIVSLLTKAPSKEIVEEFESVKTYQE